MDAPEFQIRRKYARLLQALPPLPSPTQLHKKIIETCTRLHEALSNVTPLTKRIKDLRNSTKGWKECIAELQIIETLVEKQVLEFALIRTELRTLSSVPPLLIATERISKKNWQAITTHPQYDEQNNIILTKHNAIEAVIEDQLLILSDQQAMLSDFRRTLQEEKRRETQEFEAAVSTSLENIQNMLKQELKEVTKKCVNEITATLCSMKEELTTSLQNGLQTAQEEAVATTLAESTRKQGMIDDDAGHRHDVERSRQREEHADGEVKERERIRENAEFMEGIQDEEEEAIVRNMEWEMLQDRKRQLTRELERAEAEADDLETTVYELDLEPECDPRDFHKGNIRRADEKRIRCAFCGTVGEHYSDSCLVFPKVASRRQIVMAENRCEMCLKTLYQSHDCREERSWCYHCKEQGRHHAALCELPEKSAENNRRIEEAMERIRVVKERIKELERQLMELSDL